MNLQQSMKKVRDMRLQVGYGCSMVNIEDDSMDWSVGTGGYDPDIAWGGTLKEALVAFLGEYGDVPKSHGGTWVVDPNSLDPWTCTCIPYYAWLQDHWERYCTCFVNDVFDEVLR